MIFYKLPFQKDIFSDDKALSKALRKRHLEVPGLSITLSVSVSIDGVPIISTIVTTPSKTVISVVSRMTVTVVCVPGISCGISLRVGLGGSISQSFTLSGVGGFGISQSSE